VTNQCGKGRVVWVAAPIESSNEQVNHKLVLRLLSDIRPAPYYLQVDAHPTVEAALDSSARNVQWELVLPAEFRSAQNNLPVVYLPLGTVKWHGEHNALGLDALKAHRMSLPGIPRDHHAHRPLRPQPADHRSRSRRTYDRALAYPGAQRTGVLTGLGRRLLGRSRRHRRDLTTLTLLDLNIRSYDLSQNLMCGHQKDPQFREAAISTFTRTRKVCDTQISIVGRLRYKIPCGRPDMTYDIQVHVVP
jgi:hypothetical protein